VSNAGDPALTDRHCKNNTSAWEPSPELAVGHDAEALA